MAQLVRLIFLITIQPDKFQYSVRTHTIYIVYCAGLLTFSLHSELFPAYQITLSRSNYKILQEQTNWPSSLITKLNSAALLVMWMVSVPVPLRSTLPGIKLQDWYDRYGTPLRYRHYIVLIGKVFICKVLLTLQNKHYFQGVRRCTGHRDPRVPSHLVSTALLQTILSQVQIACNILLYRYTVKEVKTTSSNFSHCVNSGFLPLFLPNFFLSRWSISLSEFSPGTVPGTASALKKDTVDSR